jgi:hypothetical protein
MIIWEKKLLSPTMMHLNLMLSLLTDDTSIFACTGGPLKIKDQVDRTVHEDVGFNKQHIKSPIVTPR